MTSCDCADPAIRRREQQRRASNRYREKCRERVRENSRKRYAKDPQLRMAQHNKWRDKVKHMDEFKRKARALARSSYVPRTERQILVATGGRPRPETCDCCGLRGKICFDHCAKKLKFRGWLCHGCNLAIGHAKENPETLRLLAAYLEEAR